MKKIIGFLMTNKIANGIMGLLVYAFYGALIGISLTPSIFIVYKYINMVDLNNILNICLLGIIIGASIYVFFLVAIVVFGIVERVITIGFKPGRYGTQTGVFARWLIYSGMHIIMLNLVMPFISGTPWAKLYYYIIGCKIGKNVFINTKGLHDAYLLEIDDNVVIGGDTNISCHIFEGRELILEKIKIGQNSLIGANCYIMPGVEIGKNCSIGLYSYIRKRRKIEDGSVIMAIPGLKAKKVAEIIKEKQTEKV